jgi:hypothetical protein
MGLLKRDLDFHLLRAAIVIIFAWFGHSDRLRIAGADRARIAKRFPIFLGHEKARNRARHF